MPLIFRASKTFLPINFVRRRRWLSGTGVVLFLCGLTALLAAGTEYLDAADQAARQESKAAHLERQITKLSRGDRSVLVKMNPSEWHSLKQVVEELSYPWDLQLGAVERSVGKDLAILTIQPEAKSGRIRIAGEAKTLDDAIGFAERLKAEAGFQSVTVTHHEFRQVGAVRILGFSVQAQ